MPPMKKLPIDLEDLMLAFEDHSPDVSYYLDLTTGEILRVSEFDDEKESLIEKLDEEPGRHKLIEPLLSHESYRFMEDFIETVKHPELQRELQNAIQKRSPFRRFKDALTAYPEERERWFKFHEQKLLEEIKDWLERLNIETTEQQGNRVRVLKLCVQTSHKRHPSDA